MNSANQALKQYYINFTYPIGQLFMGCLLMALKNSYISVSMYILSRILKNKQMVLGSEEKDFETFIGLGIHNYDLLPSKHST